MAYQFEVSYPTNLQQIQAAILYRFPQCQYTASDELGSTIYSTNHPQQIAHVASALKHADHRLFIGVINHQGKNIYYHPAKVATLSPRARHHYIKIMEKLPQRERVLHDYLVNLYHDVPTHKEYV